ncbi:hypothetical protein [Streptomyces sp. CG 926]|uniref:hypothetical protein n=1 Tax=Streptomyces sp. CG 926 TaxID=1882405 RepID=UPI0011B4C602|nr:hypothetical protein [Streptomyces sp. CG 926]
MADHFFAGPHERYERELGDGCLSASPYRSGAVQTRVEYGVLLVTPTSRGTTLCLGSGEDDSTHPLRPVDAAVRKVLDDVRGADRTLGVGPGIRIRCSNFGGRLGRSIGSAWWGDYLMARAVSVQHDSHA